MEPFDLAKPAITEVFFNSLRQLACINGYNGHFLAANPAFVAALGWSEAELRDLPYYELLMPTERRSMIKLGASIVRNAGSEPGTYRRAFRHKNGSYRLIEWTSWPAPQARLVCSTGRVLAAVEPR
jgi:PAS domain S-box-containing protein